MPTAVAMSSRGCRTPRSSAREQRSPPRPATVPTVTAIAREIREIVQWPGAKATCSIPHHAPANAMTAASVWGKSCDVGVSPSGSGHARVHGTFAATKKPA
jgi:hypothetical protein